MRSRLVAAFVAGVIACLLIGALTLGAINALTDGATAQEAQTWQIAGGPEGFFIGEWGTGRGVNVSFDEWVESMPASCDIQTIARGASYVSAYYRCPES